MNTAREHPEGGGTCGTDPGNRNGKDPFEAKRSEGPCLRIGLHRSFDRVPTVICWSIRKPRHSGYGFFVLAMRRIVLRKFRNPR